MNEELEQAYQQTLYRITAGMEVFQLIPGQQHQGFNLWCNEQGVTSWTVITAYNPRSQVMTHEKNIQANQKLLADLQSQGFEIYDGDGVPQQGDWDTEYGFFVINISLDQVRELARKYQQNAVVVNDENNLAKILWMDYQD